MRIRRDISAIPLRSASETWDRFVALISGADSKDLDLLKASGAVIASVIADEILMERPLVLEGVGPQLRVYCRYGPDAVQEGPEVDPLTWVPTAGDWTLHVPCDAENIGWIKASLANVERRVKVYDVADEPDLAEDEATTASVAIEVNWNVKD